MEQIIIGKHILEGKLKQLWSIFLMKSWTNDSANIYVNVNYN